MEYMNSQSKYMMKSGDLGIRLKYREGKENIDESRETGLEFKMAKRRTNRRQSRSKSTVSSKMTSESQRSFIFDLNRNTQKKTVQEQSLENDRNYAERRVSRHNKHLTNLDLNGFQSRGTNQQDESLSATAIRPCLTARQTIRTENYYQKFRQTTPQLNQVGLLDGFNPKYTGGHFRNKTQNFYDKNQLAIEQQNCQRKHAFNKNRILSRITSINEPIKDSNTSKKFKISQFQLGLCCSEDIFGKTYPARHIETGTIICIKIINKREVHYELDKLIWALKLQSYQNKQYIIEIYGIFEEGDKIYVIMEHHNQGDFYLKIKSQWKMTTKEYLSYFHNICSAIGDLHGLNAVYRNLKPQNFSLFHGACKIASLSWASEINSQKNYLGAIQYSSPELLVGGKYEKPSDIWALGILLIQILTGVNPCQNLSRKKARSKILQSNFDYSSISDPNLVQLLERIFLKDPKQRPTIGQLLGEVQTVQKSIPC